LGSPYRKQFRGWFAVGLSFRGTRSEGARRGEARRGKARQGTEGMAISMLPARRGEGRERGRHVVAFSLVRGGIDGNREPCGATWQSLIFSIHSSTSPYCALLEPLRLPCLTKG